MTAKWLTFDEGAELIRSRGGSGIGYAQAIMRAACTSGEIRSRDSALLINDDGLIDMNLRPGGGDVGGAVARINVRSKYVHYSTDDLVDWLVRNHRTSMIPENAAAGAPDPGGTHLAVTTPSGGLTNKQAALKGRCSAWIRTLPTQPSRRKSDVKANAVAEIPGLSGRQFDAAWDEAAPPEWKRAGRRSEN